MPQRLHLVHVFVLYNSALQPSHHRHGVDNTLHNTSSICKSVNAHSNTDLKLKLPKHSTNNTKDITRLSRQSQLYELQAKPPIACGHTLTADMSADHRQKPVLLQTCDGPAHFSAIVGVFIASRARQCRAGQGKAGAMPCLALSCPALPCPATQPGNMRHFSTAGSNTAWAKGQECKHSRIGKLASARTWMH